MRYILNDEGYIETISFNYLVECNNKSCTEYTGVVPSGYSSLAEWSENAVIQAYKITDGNLTYDSDKETNLLNEWSSQLNEKTTDTGWLDLECSSSCAEGGYSGTPQYRKIGNHVYIRGSVLLTLSSSTITLATLPEGFRASHFFYKVNMAQGNCIWRQTVSDSGKINCEWVIDTVAGSKKTSGTAWVELNTNFLID